MYFPHQADPNAMSDVMTTPLHLAVRRKHPAVVQTLINRGADVNVKNRHGSTVLFLAVEGGMNEVGAEIKNYFTKYRRCCRIIKNVAFYFNS